MNPQPALCYGDFHKYWVPPMKCPNCLADATVDADGHVDQMRHFIVVKVVDGIEHGEWECEEAPEAERKAAGYLMTIAFVPDDGGRANG